MTSDDSLTASLAAQPVSDTTATLSRRARRLAQAGSLVDPAAVIEAPEIAEDAVVLDVLAVVEAPEAATTPVVVDMPGAADAAEAAPSLAEPVVPDAAEEPFVEIIAELAVADEIVFQSSEPVIAEPVAEPASEVVDAFARASDAFGFSPVDDTEGASEVPAADEPVLVGAAPASGDVAPRRRIGRRVLAAGASLGVMGVAGLIAVSMTLPASAVAAVQGSGATPVASLVAPDETAVAGKKVSQDEIQAFVASEGVQDAPLTRSDDYQSVSLLEVAAEERIKFSDSLYTNDPNAAIQWPFMVGVAMSSGYGMRNGRMHAGIDLVPGSGATIQAIADGTVRIATESGGAYGVSAYVDHVIDGKVVTSHYAHMQYGSLEVRAGQKVKVGDTIGKVGNTGRSYGAHLHFEVIINGSTVNPVTWMRENAGRYSY